MKCLGSGNAGNRDEENFKKDILNPEVRYSSEKKKKKKRKRGKKAIAMKISIPFHWEIDSATALVDKFFETFVTNRGVEMK